MRHRLPLVALAVLAFGAALAQGIEDPIPGPIPVVGPSVQLVPVATGLTGPNWGTSAPGYPDVLFVVDQDGILWRVDLLTGVKTVFLDVSAMLVPLGAFGPGTFDERGFLGVAFHPDYLDNGLLYTFITEPADAPPDFTTLPTGTPANSQTVILEWQVQAPGDPTSVVDPASARELLRIDKPQFNHNGGAVAFGPDGYLYISLGDGGAGDDQGPGHASQGNGQDASNILGSLLRIDPLGNNSANGKYGIPADNPFVSDPARLDEIWAYGFRNPFRFSFDTATGTLWAGDVGQNDIEEVDVVVKGGNYGWRLKEGTFLFEPNGTAAGFVTADSPGSPADLIDPVAQYDHDEGIAVLGGFVYHGDAVPALRNRYVFAELLNPSTGAGRLLTLHPDGNVVELKLRNTPSAGFFLGLGQDGRGEVYLMANATLVPFGDTGVVYRIAPHRGRSEQASTSRRTVEAERLARKP
jgi:glucose/arabinose dehydrogenase